MTFLEAVTQVNNEPNASEHGKDIGRAILATMQQAKLLRLEGRILAAIKEEQFAERLLTKTVLPLGIVEAIEAYESGGLETLSLIGKEQPFYIPDAIR